MTKNDKDKLMTKALIAISQNRKSCLDKLRDVFAIMIIEDQSWGRMAKLVKEEGLNFTAGQIKYHFHKKPLTDNEILTAKAFIDSTNLNELNIT